MTPQFTQVMYLVVAIKSKGHYTNPVAGSLVVLVAVQSYRDDNDTQTSYHG
jgi:hypothetical protein